MNIYELNELQKEILDVLFWEDEEEKDQALQLKLNQIKGEVTNKLEFLSTILAESKLMTKARKEAKDKAQARLQTAQNAEERLNSFIKQTMMDFDIKKIVGKECNITLCSGREKLVYDTDFDVYSLPESARKTTVTTVPIADEVMGIIDSLEGVHVVKDPYIMVK